MLLFKMVCVGQYVSLGFNNFVIEHGMEITQFKDSKIYFFFYNL